MPASRRAASSGRYRWSARRRRSTSTCGAWRGSLTRGRGGLGVLRVERETQEIDVNVRAVARLAHTALEAMVPKKSGAIINVASVGAFQPVPYMATYAATKAFVLHFSEALHEEARS